MKRAGYIYEQMADWANIVEAERISLRRKKPNKGTISHAKNRIRNLVQIQQNVLEGKMRTSEYIHEERISGQGKVRDIAKLYFHPNHIQHQLLAIVTAPRIERALVHNTYACRTGKGQIAAALKIRDNLRKHKDEYLWYCQCDIVKYYDSIPHKIIREQMERMFKDERLIAAYLEPFERFNSSGRGIPLGARPSQSAGNFCLNPLDRFATEVLHCKGYIRYLDDFIFFGHTKGEVKAKFKRIEEFIKSLDMRLHIPKIHRVSHRIDMLGFVYDGTPNGMFWRKSNKTKWLYRRARAKSRKRLRELDDAAWGMLKWGNRHCKRLFEIKTGERRERKKMAIPFKLSGIQRRQRTDSNGRPFIEAPKISMCVILGREVEVLQVVKDIETENGKGRYALRIKFAGNIYKLIVNASSIKAFCDDMEENHVTRFRTVFVDSTGCRHYDVDEERTEIIEIDGQEVYDNMSEEITTTSGEKVVNL